MATITVRRPTFDLSDLPRRWVGGSRLGTWFGNAGHVFIPLGEEFFIDAVKEFRDRIDDPLLRREVASFMGQEAVHARIHQSVWDELRAQGVPVDAYASTIEQLRRTLEPFVPAELRLATTAALEHFTAAFGRAFLDEDLEGVLPEPMAALLVWHGAEELEHRSVAFDVLAGVDDDLALRVAGLALAATLLVVVPGAGVALFAAADLVRGRLRPVVRLPNPALMGMSSRFFRHLGREVARYVAPSFHPGRDALPESYRAWAAAQSVPA
ncbi:MAG TPA: metal-dependent hydrolase [Acidimicrobiales bacterium]|nr:metal-dependent hydrolase [Acidimicrobiales bacterium]